MIKTTTIAAAGLLISSSALADFQWVAEANLGSESKEWDNTAGGTDVDTDTLDLHGTYYFNSVATANLPYRVAGFASRNSSISLNINQRDPDQGDKESSTLASLDWHFTDSKWRMAAVLGSDDDGNEDGDVFGIGVGYYVANQGLLGFTSISRSYDNYDIGSLLVEYDMLIDLNAGHLFIDSAITSTTVDVDNSNNDPAYFDAVAKVTYYPNPQLGVGGSINFGGIDYDTDALSGNQDVEGYFYIGGHINYDFNEQIGIQAEITSGSGTVEYQNSGINTTNADQDYTNVSLSVGVQGRF